MRSLLRRDQGGTASRLLFATDLHGSERCYLKLLNAAHVYKARTVVIGGDLAGKAMVPILVDNGTAAATFGGSRQRLATTDEIAAFETRLRDAGYYPFRCDRRMFEALQASPELVNRTFLRVMQETLTRWLRLARERLVARGVRFMLNCGNDDPLELDPILNDAEGIEFLEGRVVPLHDGLELASVGFANPTPWHCPRDVPEAELAARIEAVVAEVRSPATAIFNFHCPPYNSSLEVAPRLDDTLRPVMIGGVMEMAPVGSTAVRAAIERHQPLLSLHGHIHESRGAKRIGRTLCINPGSEYAEGVLRAAIIDLEQDRVKSYLLVSA